MNDSRVRARFFRQLQCQANATVYDNDQPVILPLSVRAAQPTFHSKKLSMYSDKSGHEDHPGMSWYLGSLL